MISIIIPVYNAEKYVRECLESALRNQEGDIEVIVIDDGSTDDTFNICREIGGYDKRVRLYTQENKGVSSARNKGLKEAKGEWIVFLDGDDKIQIDCFIDHLAVMKDDVDVVLCNHQVLYPGKLEQKDRHSKLCYTLVSQEEKSMLVVSTLGMKQSKLNVNLTAPWGKAYRRKLLVQMKIMFDEGVRIGEDLLFNLYVYQCSKTIALVNEVSYYYIQHPSSVMNQIRKQGLEIELVFHKKVQEFLKNYDLWDTHYKAYSYSVLNGMLTYLTNLVRYQERDLHFKEQKQQLEYMRKQQMYREAYDVYKDNLRGYFTFYRRLLIETIFKKRYIQAMILLKVKDR